MKRLSTGLLAALVAVGIGTTSVSASNSAQAQRISASTQIAQAPADTPPADFGTPPSGEVPILFNDRHVYSKPDRLKANRVLAAAVRDNTILIPLRSTFEQMGAPVAYDPALKTPVGVSKPRSHLTVAVGRLKGMSSEIGLPVLHAHRYVADVPIDGVRSFPALINYGEVHNGSSALHATTFASPKEMS